MPPIVKVSLSDALKEVMARRELQFKKEDLPPGVEMVQLSRGERPIPAVVGIRSDLRQCEDVGVRQLHRWRLVVSPYNERLLLRLLGRTKGDLSSAGSVRYEIEQALQLAHLQVSMLDPSPPVHFVLKIFTAFEPTGAPIIEWEASSLETLRTDRERILRENAIVRANAWPFGRPINFGILRWGKGTIKHVPELPERDTYVEQVQDDLQTIINQSFAPALQSLWRAVFADGDSAEQLSHKGFDMMRIGKTQLGQESLARLVKDRRGRLTHMTLIGFGHPAQHPKRA